MEPTIQMFEEMQDNSYGKVSDTEKHETEAMLEFMMPMQDLNTQKASA